MYNRIANRALWKEPGDKTETSSTTKFSKTSPSDDIASSSSKKRPSRSKKSVVAELPPAPKPEPNPSDEKKDDSLTMNITIGTRQRQTTGFAIASRGDYLKILTCAHIVEDVYSRDRHTVTIEELNTAFTFDVVCMHQENRILEMDSTVPISRRTRMMTQVRAAEIDTSKDLLVLELNIGYLRLSEHGYCHSDHPIIPVAQIPPQVREKVILLGWPPHRSQSVSGGKVSFLNRTYDTVCHIDFNLKGYRMKLMEVSGLVYSHGYSGGPLLNNNSEFTGMYHGTIEMKGYSVSLEEIHSFLTRFEVMTKWPADE
uniref:Peptidase S1 domain-containing protein n=1 Tax=Leersia perrieri TaxID=77586 RepID=A0A0D9WD33_9ORYZ